MYGFRGGGDRGSGPPPPFEICQKWGLVWMFGLMGRRGGPKVVFSSYFFSWLASLASDIHGVNVKKKLISNHFQVQSAWKSRIQNHLTYWTYDPWPSWKSISRIILSTITRFFTILTKNFLGKDPRPPINNTFYAAYFESIIREWHRDMKY